MSQTGLMDKPPSQLATRSTVASTDRVPVYADESDTPEMLPLSLMDDVLPDITDYQKFLGIQDVINFDIATGTWTTVRVAQGDYVKQKTATDETAILAIDITEAIRTATGKGLKLTSFDVIFRNITADLDAHSVTLDKIAYVDSDTVVTTNIALTGALGVGQDNDPQIDNVVIDTPAFNITADSKYVIELTVNAAATSVYDFIGVMLKFTKSAL